MNDYVIDPYNHANFRGNQSKYVKYNPLVTYWERVHLRNNHTRLRSANEGNTDMGVP